LRKFALLALLPFALTAACGGGGEGPVTGGGGGGGGSPGNVDPVVVDSGPSAANPSINTAFVSVTICAPGNPNNCQVIPYVEIDTGSTGLRVVYSALTPALAAALQTATVNGNPLTECLQFAVGSSYGSVKIADMTMSTSGEHAAGVALQLIGDPAYPLPLDCMVNPQNNVDAFGANGLLGIGPLAQDCGTVCTTPPALAGTYYSCPSPSTCAGTTVTLAEQLQNPVKLLSQDYNGVIIELEPVGSGGAATAAGSLVFGIGTQTNNGLATATVLTVDSGSGFFLATYPVNGTQYPAGILDSGSNANYFNDNTISVCPSTDTVAPGFYCPAATLTGLSATLQGTNNAMLTAVFDVANAHNLLMANPSFTAFSNLAAPPSGTGATQDFDLGLPYFFGRNIYIGMEGENTPGGMGPYVAY